jgi:lipoate-protein ligase A
VEPLTCRLLPYAVASGAQNMAVDEGLLGSALAGQATLRFYGWSEPTLSLGYFQPQRVRLEDEKLAALAWVRRPSGGATLVHHHELTYALALPPAALSATDRPWLRRMHEVIAAALAGPGVETRAHTPMPGEAFTGTLCFHHFAAGDLLIGPGKVVGSAQRKHRGALLQHGAILLARSTFTPSLPGIVELSGRRLSVEEVQAAVLAAFCHDTGWTAAAGEMTAQESEYVGELVARKYTAEAWNRKR